MDTEVPTGEPTVKKWRQGETPSAIVPDINMDEAMPSSSVDDTAPEPSGPGIPGPTSISCMYGLLVMLTIYGPSRNNLPIHLDPGMTWTEAALLTSSESGEYRSNYEVISKKDKSGRKKKKGKQPAKQAAPMQPLPMGYIHLQVIPGCDGIQSPIFGRWFNPTTSQILPECKNQMGGMLG
ncbi:hypothetical protein P691DRAFT_762654 [Macrolepiota fuliginosa MF-IS2]|uniref:Uncharacterized protein n=1 Tax=Macrolepiota fuliginosa MF-IS2 TaxID=1400762 RepID=A0A9P5X8W2_9AGAR|nr:hypothetical protein P691DRAFT_762654 [Macrolepiota fuliginosa MF-IS2]